MCEYCGEELGYVTYSIPLNEEGTRRQGEFCSRECRVAANQYIHDPPIRSIQNAENRHYWITAEDHRAVGHYVKSAPPPQRLKRWNKTGLKREQWMNHPVSTDEDMGQKKVATKAKLGK